MSTSLVMFLVFIGVTLVITYWASKRTKTTAEFYSAGRSITGFQNGWAVAGDYMSAASFLGIAGLIAFNGYDGFLYSVGWLVAYLTVLLIVAEPLRNTGKFTMADVLAFRLQKKSVRTIAACSTLTVSLFYMIAQMVGAGSLVSLLIPQISFNYAIVLVGVLMLVYVIFGGMLATTWVQIIKAVLLMGGTILLSIMVLARFGFSITEFFEAISQVTGTVTDAAGNVVTKDFTQPGLRYNGTWGALDLISLGIALIFGTAGLPHILIRFYTVPSAQQARKSVVWAMILIGAFYIMTTFLGLRGRDAGRQQADRRAREGRRRELRHARRCRLGRQRGMRGDERRRRARGEREGSRPGEGHGPARPSSPGTATSCRPRTPTWPRRCSPLRWAARSCCRSSPRSPSRPSSPWWPASPSPRPRRSPTTSG